MKASKTAAKRTVPYNMVDDADRAKRERELRYHMNYLDESGKLLKPLTESQVLTLCRKAIREFWMYSHSKMAFLLLRKEEDTNTNTKRRWHYNCDICNEWFGGDEVEVDHKIGEHSLRTSEEVLAYAEAILSVTFEDLQLLCKPCHAIKTLAERNKISFEDAKILKSVIQFEKEHSVPQTKNFLMDNDIKEDDTTNQKKRREALMIVFKRKMAESDK